jgi:hypothetical protein
MDWACERPLSPLPLAVVVAMRLEQHYSPQFPLLLSLGQGAIATLIHLSTRADRQ